MLPNRILCLLSLILHSSPELCGQRVWWNEFFFKRCRTKIFTEPKGCFLIVHGNSRRLCTFHRFFGLRFLYLISDILRAARIPHIFNSVESYGRCSPLSRSHPILESLVPEG